jgi:hypothetical protein
MKDMENELNIKRKLIEKSSSDINQMGEMVEG